MPRHLSVVFARYEAGAAIPASSPTSMNPRNPRKLAEEARKIAAAFELADGPVVPSLDASILSSISAIPAALIAQADLLEKYRVTMREHFGCFNETACDLCRAYDAMLED